MLLAKILGHVENQPLFFCQCKVHLCLPKPQLNYCSIIETFQKYVRILMNYDRYVTFSKKPHAGWFARGFAVFI